MLTAYSIRNNTVRTCAGVSKTRHWPCAWRDAERHCPREAAAAVAQASVNCGKTGYPRKQAVNSEYVSVLSI